MLSSQVQDAVSGPQQQGAHNPWCAFPYLIVRARVALPLLQRQELGQHRGAHETVGNGQGKSPWGGDLGLGHAPPLGCWRSLSQQPKAGTTGPDS